MSSKLCAEAVCAARRIEMFMPMEGIDPYEADRDAEQYEITYPKLKWALRRLHEAFPEVDPCPMLAHASQHHTPGRAHVVVGCLQSGRGLCTRKI